MPSPGSLAPVRIVCSPSGVMSGIMSPSRMPQPQAAMIVARVDGPGSVTPTGRAQDRPPDEEVQHDERHPDRERIGDGQGAAHAEQGAAAGHPGGKNHSAARDGDAERAGSCVAGAGEPGSGCGIHRS